MATKTLSENINQAISDFNGIKQAIIDKGVEIPTGTKTSEYGAKISEIQGGGGGLDTSGVTNFYQFCYGNRFNDQLDKIDTRSGTDFAYMFNECSILTTIPKLDISNGTSFRYMFQNCTKLTNIPQLDTSQGTNFSYMFYKCSNLTNIPQLDTSSGINFNAMFQNCTKLTNIPKINTSKATDFGYMFGGCSTLTTIPQLDTSSGINFSNMFSVCEKLTTIPQLDTSRGNSFSSMFYRCSKLTTINLSSFYSSNYMFESCIALENLNVTGTITVKNNYLNLSYSKNLTVESLLNVLNALSDNTSVSTTYKITLGSTNLAKLTDEQKQIAINKNYTLA